MMDEPFFTVAVPTHNRAEDLRRLLDSLCAQKFTDFEVIIGDNGSTDHTPEVIRNYSDRLSIRHIREENWGGPARPRNNCIRAARGEWVCFLDSDDWWYPEKLSTIRRYCDRTDFIFHRLDIWSAAGKTRKKTAWRRISRPVLRDFLIFGNPVSTSSAAVRSSLLREHLFSEDRDLITVEDFDLWLRLVEEGAGFIFLRDVLGAYWLGDANLSAGIDSRLERLRRVYEKYAVRLTQPEKKQSSGYCSYVAGRLLWQGGKKKEAAEEFQYARRNAHWRIRTRAWIMTLAAVFS